MATVVKNFRIKSGLIVEGTTGTINGQNILRETGSDSYILNLVGGATLVKSVEATQLEVNGAGKLSVKSGVFEAAGAAAAAKTAAEATASADATSKANAAQSAAEATAAAANAAQQAGTTAFTALNVNDQAKQIAASSSGTASVAGTAYQWAKADYRSAKLLVKIDNASHNEISEILLTLDASDNVAITEYAIVGTNGSRGTITAEVSGSNVLVKVTPTDNSTIKVSGTLLK